MARGLLGLGVLVLVGLGWGARAELRASPEPRGSQAGDEVVVQHLLVSFRGAAGFGRRLPPRALQRSAAQADELIAHLELLLSNQEPFAGLIQRHSDDFVAGPKPEGKPACADGCGPTGEAPGAYRVVVGSVAEGVSGPQADLHHTLEAAARHLMPGEWLRVAYHPEHAPLGHHLVRRLR